MEIKISSLTSNTPPARPFYLQKENMKALREFLKI